MYYLDEDFLNLIPFFIYFLFNFTVITLARILCMARLHKSE